MSSGYEISKDSKFQEIYEELLGDFGDSKNSAIRGETALWRAVIVQALVDAKNNSDKTEQKYEQARAIAWLSGTSKDFALVCQFAELEFEYVKEKISKVIETRNKHNKKTASNNLPCSLRKIRKFNHEIEVVTRYSDNVVKLAC